MKAVKMSRKSMEVGQMHLTLFPQDQAGTPAWAEKLKYESKLMELFQVGSESHKLQGLFTGILDNPKNVLRAVRCAMVPATFAA